MEASYNDVPKWQYSKLPDVFGGKAGQFKSRQVKTREEL